MRNPTRPTGVYRPLNLQADESIRGYLLRLASANRYRGVLELVAALRRSEPSLAASVNATLGPEQPRPVRSHGHRGIQGPSRFL